MERLNAALITFTDGHKIRILNKYRGGYNTKGQKEVGNTGKRENLVLWKYVKENISKYAKYEYSVAEKC